MLCMYFFVGQPDNVVIAIASMGDLRKPTKRSWDSLYKSLEKVGKFTHHSRLRNATTQQAYVFIVDKGKQNRQVRSGQSV